MFKTHCRHHHILIFLHKLSPWYLLAVAHVASSLSVQSLTSQSETLVAVEGLLGPAAEMWQKPRHLWDDGSGQLDISLLEYNIQSDCSCLTTLVHKNIA